MVAALVEDLLEEAGATNERRGLVLHGRQTECEAALDTVLDTVPGELDEMVYIGSETSHPMQVIDPQDADDVLGTTQDVVILDWHVTCRPNALGQVVGAVDGGGLLIMLAPSLNTWDSTRCAFEQSMVVPPATSTDVGHHYHRRVVELVYAHRGIAVVDVDAGHIEQSGRTNPAPRLSEPGPAVPTDITFPRAAYEACRSPDQISALETFEALIHPNTAIVMDADRGRGKSSVAGLAAASFALRGETVLITAPTQEGTTPLFDRVQELLATVDEPMNHEPTTYTTTTGGRVEFVDPTAIPERDDEPLVFVDEAAGLSVDRLAEFLTVDRLAFITTVHGYEGAGRGFDVRFRDHLQDARHAVQNISLTTPIRYAAGDPLEVWAFHTLLLDARPPVDQLVTEATPASVSVDVIAASELAADERLLHQVFGLLVTAHYRTEPNDLARLLDAPNISLRALKLDGHVVSVALIAREGGLDADTRNNLYDGGQIRGHMLPDLFASQLRDPDGAGPEGWRIMRIATHPAVRERGLGSLLLRNIIAAGRAADIDWVGVGYGATPNLVSFWAANGFHTMHLATTKTQASGEHSIIMVAPISDAGVTLMNRLGTWFLKRFPAMLTDTLREVDPDIVRATLRATHETASLDLSARDWRVVASAAYGPGRFDVDPTPFRSLALRYFTDSKSRLSDRAERLLVRKVFQGIDAELVAGELGYNSRSECMRAVGDAFAVLCEMYGGEVAASIRTRYAE